MISNVETLAAQPITLAVIEKRAADYAQAREELASEITAMQEEMEAVKRRRLKAVKAFAAAAAADEAKLRWAIESAPELFKKPKTITLHGIKVGYRNATGKLVFDDAETVVKLIKRHFKGQEDLLIRTKEEPNKDGLKTLSEEQLARLGCRYEGAGDRVVLDAVDDEIERMLSKLISDMVDTILEEKEAA